MVFIHIVVAKSDPDFLRVHDVSNAHMPDGRFWYRQFIRRGGSDRVQLYLLARQRENLRSVPG